MKFGAAGRQRVEQGFTAAHTGALTLQVYQQLLANRQSAAAPGNRQR
jgi:hypothetical protein